MSILVSCSFHSEDSPCDQVGIGNTIIPLPAFTRDVKPLLKTIGASGRTVVSEDDLILNRAGYFRVTPEQKAAMTVCPKHRNSLTKDWVGRKTNKCAYPSYEGPQKKLPNPRRVTTTMSIKIYDLHGKVVPIGSGKVLNTLKWTGKREFNSRSNSIVGYRHVLKCP